MEANAMDLAQAKENGMSTVMQDRLLLTKERIEGIAASVLDVVKLEDPVGQVVEGYRTVSGLNIQRIRVPMGVIGIIFESRPNVTVDAAALCLESGQRGAAPGRQRSLPFQSGFCPPDAAGSGRMRPAQRTDPVGGGHQPGDRH